MLMAYTYRDQRNEKNAARRGAGLLFIWFCMIAFVKLHAAHPAVDADCPDAWDAIDWNSELAKAMAPAFLRKDQPRFQTGGLSQLPIRPRQTQAFPPPTWFRPVGCHREYKWRSRTLLLDSARGLDAEGLRRGLKLQPQAIQELELYQSQRASIESNAYIGSVGVAVILLSLVGSSIMKGASATLIRNLGFVIGGSITGGAVAYSLYQLKQSDEHLQRAVQIQNAATPNDPISLSVSTGFFF